MRSPHDRPLIRRALGAALVGALVSLLPFGAAQAQEARDVDEACRFASESGFSDRPEGGFGEAVDCVSWYGVAQGFADGTYGPGRTVTRGQMATFLVNALRVAGADLPDNPPDAFADDDGHAHEANIDIAAELGIARGVTATEFRPNASVRRDQMASFVARQAEAAIGEALAAAAADHFTDDDGNTHEDRINQLADVGIVAGAAEGQYNPGGSVTRQQMALFISRDLDFMTEDHGVALRRIGVGVAVTNGPDLLTVTEVSRDAAQATLEFAFDEAVGNIVAERFAIYTVTGERKAATAAQATAGKPAAVRASFSRADFDVATVAGVQHNAVQSPAPESIANPEGSAPLEAVTLPGGTTSRADLVSVTNVNGAAGTATFRFDEDATNTDAAGYHLVLADGTQLDSTAVNSGDGGTSHTVAVANLTASNAGQVVRGYVDSGAIEDDDGNASPQQAAPVSAQGRTDDPDLVSITLVPGQNQVEFVFDEAVTLPATNPIQPAPPFRIYYLDGGEVTADSRAVKQGANAVVVATFGAGEVNETVAGGSVDSGAVTDGRADEVGLDAEFAAGDTAAPVLLSAGVSDAAGPLNTTNRSVVFTFDQAVASPVAGKFVVYAADGTRTVLPGAGASCSASANTVTCTSNSGAQAGTFGAIGNAVLAAIVDGAVKHPGGAYFSHEGAAVL